MIIKEGGGGKAKANPDSYIALRAAQKLTQDIREGKARKEYNAKYLQYGPGGPKYPVNLGSLQRLEKQEKVYKAKPNKSIRERLRHWSRSQAADSIAEDWSARKTSTAEEMAVEKVNKKYASRPHSAIDPNKLKSAAKRKSGRKAAKTR
jgi:hypothetical protein